MRLLTAALAMALLGGSAAATETESRLFQLEPVSPTCAAPPAGQGKPLELAERLDGDTQAALSAGVFLALHDTSGADTWPTADIEAAKPCSLARFEAGAVVWTIAGAEGRAPPRWVRTPGREAFFYLARGPALPDALAWSRSRQGLPPGALRPAYYLVGLADGEHFVFQIYDDLPDTRQLADDVRAVVESTRTPLAVLAGGDTVTLFRETVSGTHAELFRPATIRPARPAHLYGPDGHFFTGAIEQDWKLRGSGFVCPAALGKFERLRAAVLNATDVALDLHCSLATDESFTSIFVSRVPDRSADKAYFARQLADAERSLEAPRKLRDPPTGPKRPIQAGRAWVDKGGLMQEVMFMRRGDYIVELRGTYVLADVEAAGEALIRLIEMVTPSAQGR